MFAAKFALKRVSPTRLHVFSPISSFVQVRFQRAEVAQPRSTSDFIDEEPLPFDQIPGPRGRFPTVIEFYRQSDGFSKFYKLMQKLFKVYGPIFKEDVTNKTPTCTLWSQLTSRLCIELRENIRAGRLRWIA